MPRIYTSANDPIDFCKKHFPQEKDALADYGNLGNGPDNRGNCFEYNAEHPFYEGEEYRCDKCNKLLTQKDE